MRDIDRLRAQEEARWLAARSDHATRYSIAINRYLGAAGYPTRVAAGHPAPPPGRARGAVVVGVDDSPISHVAADHAAIEAELRGWDLRLVHVQPAGHASRNAAVGLLERVTDRVNVCSPTVAVHSRLAVGAPAAVLLAACRPTDVLVAGHRHGAFSTAFGAAVGEKLAEQHPGPTMIVRVPVWPARPEFTTRPVAVGDDGSAAAAPAREFALREARLRGCEVIVVHASAKRSVQPDRIEKIDGVVVHHRAVNSDPVSALHDVSGRAAAVVLGRRGAGQAGGLIGSVSRWMVQHADCPVFLVG